MYDDFLLLKIIRHDLHVAFSQSPYISILWVEDVGAERGGDVIISIIYQKIMYS